MEPWRVPALAIAPALAVLVCGATTGDEHCSASGGSGIDRGEVKDRAFFDTYSSPENQARMLLDTRRTQAYHDAVMGMRGKFKDRTVLDVGCGTGILSMFAAKAGARRVLCVEYTAVAEVTAQLVAANGMGGVVTVIRGKMEDVDLGVDHVDIIISEWMGYMGLFEGMYRSVLWARDKYLQPGGLMLPSSIDLHLAAATVAPAPSSNVTARLREPLFGLDFSGLAPVLEAWADYKIEAARADWRQGSYPEIAQVPPEEIITRPARLASIDMTTVTIRDLDEVSAAFAIPALQSGSLDRLVGWFVCRFDGGGAEETAITLDTGPAAPATHWHQMVFHLAAPVAVTKGVAVKGAIVMRMSGQFHREMNVHASLTSPERVAKLFTVVIVPDTSNWAQG